MTNNKEKIIGYALALFEIFKEEGKLHNNYEEAKKILESIEQNPELENLLDDYSTQNEEKDKMIKTIYSNFNLFYLNSMALLAQSNKFRIFKDILRTLIKFFQKELKIKEGVVFSTQALSKNQINQIEKKLSNELNNNVCLVNYIDKELVLGIKIIIDDLVIEHSLINDLEILKKDLLIDKKEG